MKIAIVVVGVQFRSDHADGAAGAHATPNRSGVEVARVVHVPGVFDMAPA